MSDVEEQKARMSALMELTILARNLEGPDRQFDIKFGEYFFPEPRSFNLTDRVLRNGKPSCPKFTESVDEVMKLVPEGYSLTVTKLPDGRGDGLIWKDRYKSGSGFDGVNPAVAAILAIIHHQRDALRLPESTPFSDEVSLDDASEEKWYSEKTRQVDRNRYKPGGLINFTGLVMDVAMAGDGYLMLEYSSDTIVRVDVGQEHDSQANEIMDTFDKKVAVQVKVSNDYTLTLNTVRILD